METAAWLIERKDTHLCYSDGGTSFRWVTFTDRHAWRFDTQEDAERIIKEHGLTDIAAAVSHGWVDGPDAGSLADDWPNRKG